MKRYPKATVHNVKIVRLEEHQSFDIEGDPYFTGILEWENGHKQWIKKGRFHRLDGPAVEHPSGSCYYYINGIETTELAMELFAMSFKEEEE
jgi:hypothetical protein